jgi:hypothetical protein
MEKLKDGSFTLTTNDRSRNGKRIPVQGENVWNEDRYVPTPFGDAEKSVVIV